MKSKQKNLQKFTDTEARVNQTLALKLITHAELEQLSEPEQALLMKMLTEKYNSLKGEEKDNLYKKMEPILSSTSKNQLWESNHSNITCAISHLMQEYGRMPSKTEISKETGLSRQTVHKHLKEYATHPLYLQQAEQFQFMASKVLARVFKFAVNGDIGAAKLYFNVIGNMSGQKSNKTSIQTQNNFIQINGTVLSQETIKQLNPEQLNTIEAMLKTALPQFGGDDRR